MCDPVCDHVEGWWRFYVEPSYDANDPDYAYRLYAKRFTAGLAYYDLTVLTYFLDSNGEIIASGIGGPVDSFSNEGTTFRVEVRSRRRAEGQLRRGHLRGFLPEPGGMTCSSFLPRPQRYW